MKCPHPAAKSERKKVSRKLSRWGSPMGGRKSRFAPRGLDEAQDIGTDQHPAQLKYVAQEPIPSQTHLYAELSERFAPHMPTLRTTGLANEHTWRLSIGDTKAFVHPPKHAADVWCLIDLSGSLDCWCRDCQGHRAVTAFGVAGALARVLPQTTFLGFVSDAQMSYLVPLAPGMQPICRLKCKMPTGNPDCTALGYLRDSVFLLSNGIAVIISDGLPEGPAPQHHTHLRTHTTQLAQQLYDKGLRYASVLVSTWDTGIYPTDVSITCDSLADVWKVGNILEYITERR